MRYLLGIDLGSSSVKVSLVEAGTGRCAAAASYPASEAPIKALQPGWAEQRPCDWWDYFKQALGRAIVSGGIVADDIAAIGISYQMHGLVCLDKDLQPLRDAIIWCDSRGVPYGSHAPIPGNFTAAKLAWVKEHEPALFDRIRYVMLPGDWLALRLGADPATTACGLSEMMLWDFGADTLSTRMLDHFGFPSHILPPLVPTFGEQGRVGSFAAAELGLPAGIPITYRAGDQPNNALSLAVLDPGEVAATAGTSGVVYGVLDRRKTSVVMNSESRVNTFLHVNGQLGLMHCINGCGIMNAWMRRMVADPATSYDDINRLAAQAPAGADGLCVVPFGNGAERVLLNRNIGASIHGIDLNRHGQAHLLRAAQEGIAFAFVYGMEAMNGPESGLPGCSQRFTTIHAGRANMFLSPLFRQTLADLSGASIGLYDTDGSVGAARGAGLGAGIYASPREAFASLNRLALVEPQPNPAVSEAYLCWKEILNRELQ